MKNNQSLMVERKSFGNCSDAYEEALKRITELEIELHDAKNEISNFQIYKSNLTPSHNQSLFDALVCSAPEVVSAKTNSNNSLIINLTSHNSHLNSSKEVKRIKCSRNKLKKYIKINKYIKKTNKLVNKQKLMNKNVKFSKERIDLINQLNLYSLTIQKNQLKYESDINKLNNEILNLQKSLGTMNNRYNVTNKQVKDQVLALDELLINKESLTRHHKCVTYNLEKKFEPTCEPLANQQLPSHKYNQNTSSSNTKSISSFKPNNV
ncbi:unnamed protein product [Leptidea sinapis]|uniref:Uncharacterized protein n=1 Tax=Leptidea sinapis TaxID=189913 RepID=A0A5E4QW78_9NEOP|nr:unnamed protein product [Leptidea sinapis]